MTFFSIFGAPFFQLKSNSVELPTKDGCLHTDRHFHTVKIFVSRLQLREKLDFHHLYMHS